MQDLSKCVKECVVPVPFVLYTRQTVGEAILSLKDKKIDDRIIYFYAVDDNHRLKGVVSTRTLLFKESNLTIAQVMDPTVIRISCEQTLRDAMEYLAAHRLLAVPVIHEGDKLLGVINVDHYMEEKVPASEAFQILGVTLEEGKRRSPLQNYRLRMPWILCNMAGGTACAVISQFFEPLLLKVILLAMFIPLVLTLSESISMQSMSQSLQLLRKQKLSWKKVIRRALLEWKVILLLALSCGLLVGLISFLWGEGIRPAATIGLGLAIAITISATIGTSVPLFLHAKEFDPKVAAGPVVLMFSDVITTLVYLGLGSLLLS
jgi:magnesium transporter